MSYRDRKGGTAADGSPIFATLADTAAEDRVAAALAVSWRCELHRFGALAPIDWWAARHGRVVALVEVKSRSHTADRFSTVYLNVRKWLSLQLAAVGLGVPSFFVVAFSGGDVRWVDIATVDATRVVIGGCSHRVKSRGDVEPVIEVPISTLRRLASQGGDVVS